LGDQSTRVLLPVGLSASHSVFVLAGKVKCPARDTNRPSPVAFNLLFSADTAGLERQYGSLILLLQAKTGEMGGLNTLARRTALLVSASMIQNVIPMRVMTCLIVHSCMYSVPSPRSSEGFRRSVDLQAPRHPGIKAQMLSHFRWASNVPKRPPGSPRVSRGSTIANLTKWLVIFQCSMACSCIYSPINSENAGDFGIHHCSEAFLKHSYFRPCIGPR
jgi:hypothetical protein